MSESRTLATNRWRRMVAAVALLAAVLCAPATSAAIDAPTTPGSAATEPPAPPPASHAAGPGPASSPSERSASRSWYGSQTAADALATAKGSHPGTVLDPFWQLRTPGGTLASYLSDHIALIDTGEGGHRALAVSMLPLRTEDASGDPVPLDLSLVRHGDAYSPAQPLAPLTLPASLDQGIRLPQAGIALKPLGAAGAADAAEVGEKLFWANFATDSDFLAGPIPGGAETLVQLRSAESPERIPLHLDLPPGAELRATSVGGAEVLRAGEQLAEIAPPSARDADGTAVPARYSVEGSNLVVNVDHRSGDYLYPLLLDPQIEDMRYWQSNPSLDARDWEARSCSGAPYTNAFMSGGFGKGLYTYTNGTNYFADQACGYWLWSFVHGTLTAYPSVFIYAAEFDLLSTVQDADCAYVGLVNTYAPAGWLNYVRNCGPTPWSNYSPLVCAQSGCPTTPTNVTPNNEARMETFASGAGNRSSLTTYMGGSVIYLNETVPPSTPSIPSRAAQPNAWVDAVPPVVVHGFDPNYGIGIKTFQLDVPGEGSPRIRTVSCAGDRNDRCPYSKDSDDPGVSGASYSIDAPALAEGINTFKIRTLDLLSNRSPDYTWQVKLDRTDPDLQLDGGLAANQSTNEAEPRILDHGVYDLRMSAADAYSGMRSLTVKVDGDPEYDVNNDPTGTCNATSGCPTSQSGVYEFATEAHLSGDHRIDVTATDAVGHKNTTTFYVRTNYSTDCPRVATQDQLTGRCSEWQGPDSHVSPDTFEGSCSGDGVVSSLLMDGTTIGPLYLWYYDVTDSADGSCTGLLNAQQITNAPATLELATSCIRSSPYIDTRVDGNSGHATLTFTGGTPDPGDDRALSADYQLVGAGNDKLTLSGRNGGTAVGAASFTPAQWSDHCAPYGDQFHIEFQTVTGLHDDS